MAVFVVEQASSMRDVSRGIVCLLLIVVGKCEACFVLAPATISSVEVATGVSVPETDDCRRARFTTPPTVLVGQINETIFQIVIQAPNLACILRLGRFFIKER